MKLNRLFILLLALAFGVNLQAQKATDKYTDLNLYKWVKECEYIEDIDYSVLYEKDPVTKEKKGEAVKVTVPLDKKDLVKRLYSAFSEDKKLAYKVSEKREKGVIKPDYCRFLFDKTGLRFLFEYTKIKDVQYVTVTMQIFYNYNPGDWGEMGG